MATSKPKLQGYIDQRLYEAFEAERQAWGMSQSNALERVLGERYKLDTNQLQEPSLPDATSSILIALEQRVTRLETSLLEQRFQCRQEVNRLRESIFKRFGEPLEITSDALPALEDGESPQITSDIPSTHSELLEITSDTLPALEDGEPPQITSDIPSTHSELLEITSDTLPALEDGEPPQITSDIPSAHGEPPQITSDIPSAHGEPLEITSDTLPALEDGEPPQITSDTQNKLVICKVDKTDSGNQGKWRYFASFKQGFIEQLDQARTYYPDTVRQIAGRIGKSPHKAIEGEMISWRPVAELQQLLAVGSQP